MSVLESHAFGTFAFRCHAFSACWGLADSRPDPERYPYLEAADIDEALRYAASLAEDETIELVG